LPEVVSRAERKMIVNLDYSAAGGRSGVSIR
jgi:hypothetical protein